MICIYAIINILDDKHYVGQAIDKDYRWYTHKKELRGFYHHSILLQRAWCKYGEENFIFVVLEELNDASKLNERETYWGNLLKPEYNVAPLGGSMRGYKHTEEAKENMRQSQLGKKWTEERRQKRSQEMIGNTRNNGKRRSRPTSIETRKKISEAKKIGYSLRKKSLDENLKTDLTWDDILPSLSGS